MARNYGADAVIARAQVAIAADTSAFDAAMGMLPSKSKKEIKALIAGLEAEMDAVKLQINLGLGAGQISQVQGLQKYLGQLGRDLDDVKMEAIKGAHALDAIGGSVDKAGVAVRKTAFNMKNFGVAVHGPDLFEWAEATITAA